MDYLKGVISNPELIGKQKFLIDYRYKLRNNPYDEEILKIGLLKFVYIHNHSYLKNRKNKDLYILLFLSYTYVNDEQFELYEIVPLSHMFSNGCRGAYYIRV